MEDDKIRQIEAKIEKITDLPTLPVVAMKIMELSSDADSSIVDISEVILEDPSIATKTLGIVNSAFYSIQREITSLTDAIVILGLGRVREVVTSVSVFSAFPEVSGKDEFDRSKFWEHSIGCGMVARMIADRLGYKMEGREYVAGLLHDMGKIFMDQYFHEEFIEAFDKSLKDEIPMIDAEDSVFGVNHTYIGSWLGRKWNLPSPMIDVISCHHYPLESTVDPILTSIVYLSNILCNYKGIGKQTNAPLPSLTDSGGWRILQSQNPRLEKMDMERFFEDLDEQIPKIRELIRISGV